MLLAHFKNFTKTETNVQFAFSFDLTQKKQKVKALKKNKINYATFHYLTQTCYAINEKLYKLSDGCASNMGSANASFMLVY